MKLDREILFEYFDFLDTINEKARKFLEEGNDEIKETSFNITDSIVGRLFHLNPKLLKLGSGKQVVVKPRMLACFILHLYLDVRTKDICEYYRISRATMIHYCGTIIDEYLIYDEMQNKLDRLMTKKEMASCIRKFERLKRSK